MLGKEKSEKLELYVKIRDTTLLKKVPVNKNRIQSWKQFQLQHSCELSQVCKKV